MRKGGKKEKGDLIRLQCIPVTTRAALYQDEREIAALIKRKYLVTISFPRASTSTTNLMSKSTSAV